MSLHGGHGSYDVHVWAISRYNGKRGTTYTVRWAVEGERQQQTFATRKMAESFRSRLITESREVGHSTGAQGCP